MPQAGGRPCCVWIAHQFNTSLLKLWFWKDLKRQETVWFPPSVPWKIFSLVPQSKEKNTHFYSTLRFPPLHMFSALSLLVKIQCSHFTILSGLVDWIIQFSLLAQVLTFTGHSARSFSDSPTPSAPLCSPCPSQAVFGCPLLAQQSSGLTAQNNLVSQHRPLLFETQWVSQFKKMKKLKVQITGSFSLKIFFLRSSHAAAFTFICRIYFLLCH